MVLRRRAPGLAGRCHPVADPFPGELKEVEAGGGCHLLVLAIEQSVAKETTIEE